MKTICKFWAGLVFALCLFVPVMNSGLMAADLASHNISLTHTGKFTFNAPKPEAKRFSDNGKYWCSYDIGRAGDEVRELKNFRFLEGDRQLFSMKLAPGSDLYISNSGYIAFMDHKRHYKGELTVHVYSPFGSKLSKETYHGASLFGFSSKGNKFGVGNSNQLNIISMSDGTTQSYPSGFQFDFSEDEEHLAIASENYVRVYSNGKLMKVLQTGCWHTRDVKISEVHNIVAAIDKTKLKLFALDSGSLLYEDYAENELSFRDLVIADGFLHAGVLYRSKGILKGILRTYNHDGNIITQSEEAFKQYQTFDNTTKPDDGSEYDTVPWPFVPFDEMHTVWNYYEQHMGGYGGDYSYLHQGLDMIVPIAEPTYSVQEGYVKCVLTIGGDAYWRVAISPVQEPGYSDGWLYAHLIESSIPVDVGDHLPIHTYLGDIIQWSWDWGHIHFVEIHDEGTVWEYWDNEWGINFNPLRALQPDTDVDPPYFEDVFGYSKFAYCTNETSNYLQPDNLHGDIDIIAKVVDYIGESEWQQPAFETFYWVEKLPENITVFPRTMGHRLNHSYPFYEGGNYEPYAATIFKRDNTLQPSYWMDTERNYYHSLTNSNGDSIVELWEKDLAFSTADYPDGNYRIYIEATDEYGNSTIESQDVEFNNSISGLQIYMYPEEYPIEIEAGDWFTYTGVLDNNNNYQQTVDVWIMLNVPDYGMYGPLHRYNNIPIQANQTMNTTVRQNVPIFAPSGIYQYIAYAGDYPSDIIDSTFFEFTVMDSGAQTAVEDWSQSDWFEGNSEIPEVVTLQANHPNPFNAQTSIGFSIPEPGNVRLNVYNIMGQKLATLQDGKMNAGEHSITWDADKHSSGIYFYRLEVGEEIITRRMTLLK
ncbi:MAG: T9SS type A sorting domain-containing protein [candidate division Zixibacteria bacterium]|nr:T9SS type A sorting domain-containing protein [candidate division Zixibacteria bacterium]